MKKKKTKSKNKPLLVPTWKTVDWTIAYEGTVLYEHGRTRIVVSEISLDYGGCYYEGDTPTIQVKLETQILS